MGCYVAPLLKRNLVYKKNWSSHVRLAFKKKKKKKKQTNKHLVIFYLNKVALGMT